ncbi:predicted transcriptional regulator [alpha proteobacterium BAL199]|jgi:predicted DNA-binding transcriptional regulator YafY|nr:predicted transcriptional regulator [alpha proteobacterium BAL199]
MRANRLLSILILLQSRGRLTADVLAAEFEVSVRTIYRDIDELSAAGVPVYADRGPGGGYQLLDGYRTRLTGLTSGEAETLLLVGLPGAAADLGLAEPAAMARLKLLAAVPAAHGDGAARIGDRFHLDPLDWYRRATPPPHLPAIAQAVWSERRIAICYESWSATVQRTLDPLGLVLKAGSWYLAARAERGIRTYRIAKVQTLEVLAERFVYPSGFDLAAHWRNETKRFETVLQRAKATLRVSSTALERLDRLGADIVDAVLQAAPDAEGWRQATAPIESLDHAAGLLLGFGDEIEVLEPPALRRRLAELSGTVVALYRDAGFETTGRSA